MNIIYKYMNIYIMEFSKVIPPHILNLPPLHKNILLCLHFSHISESFLSYLGKSQ